MCAISTKSGRELSPTSFFLEGKALKEIHAIFWDQVSIVQRAKLSTLSITDLCWCN
jgi:hypothetical protein